MSPLIQHIEGVSLLVCGILILFTLRRKGKNRLLCILGWFFIAGGIFRLSMLLPNVFGTMSGSDTLAILVSVVSSSCLYFGIAGYLSIQMQYIFGAYIARIAFWVGVVFAAMLTTVHTLGSGLIDPSSSFTARIAVAQQPIMLWIFSIVTLLLIGTLLLFVWRARQSQTPLLSNVTMNIGLGLMLFSWILQKTLQGDIGVTTNAVLSALPFVALGIILLAVFLQVSASMAPGVVYNAQTKQPVPLAMVRIIREDDQKLLESRVTSAQGRYGILVEPGRYRVSVTAAGFRFPSSVGLGYLGDVVEIKNPILLGFDIFLDPETPENVSQGAAIPA